METEKKDYPVNLYAYYEANSDIEKRTNGTKKIVYYVLAAICLLLIIFPSILPLSSSLIRVIGVIGLLYFGFVAYFGGEAYYNKQSGGKIVKSAVKKFDSSAVSEEALLQMFEAGDFKGFADAAEANNQPLQLYIHEDATGKVFYLQLMKYFSSSDFRGMSEVREVREPEYSEVYSTIKSIRTTTS